MPTGCKILDTYGNVIRGNMNEDIVKIAFIMKLSLSDFCFIFFIIPFPNQHFHLLFRFQKGLSAADQIGKHKHKWIKSQF